MAIREFKENNSSLPSMPLPRRELNPGRESEIENNSVSDIGDLVDGNFMERLKHRSEVTTL